MLMLGNDVIKRELGRCKCESCMKLEIKGGTLRSVGRNMKVTDVKLNGLCYANLNRRYVSAVCN